MTEAELVAFTVGRHNGRVGRTFSAYMRRLALVIDVTAMTIKHKPPLYVVLKENAGPHREVVIAGRERRF